MIVVGRSGSLSKLKSLLGDTVDYGQQVRQSLLTGAFNEPIR